MNTLQATSTTPIVQHSAAVRQQRRAKHFFADGRDLFQTKSPSLKLIGSANAVATHRQKLALKQQQQVINDLDNDFLAELFTVGITSDAYTD